MVNGQQKYRERVNHVEYHTTRKPYVSPPSQTEGCVFCGNLGLYVYIYTLYTWYIIIPSMYCMVCIVGMSSPHPQTSVETPEKNALPGAVWSPGRCTPATFRFLDVDGREKRVTDVVNARIFTIPNDSPELCFFFCWERGDGFGVRMCWRWCLFPPLSKPPEMANSPESRWRTNYLLKIISDVPQPVCSWYL